MALGGCHFSAVNACRLALVETHMLRLYVSMFRIGRRILIGQGVVQKAVHRCVKAKRWTAVGGCCRSWFFP